MEVVKIDGSERPVPEPDATSLPLFAGAAEGVLRYQRCTDCGSAQHYPRALCIACGGEPQWATASGSGSVYTFTVVRQNGLPPFSSEVPYVLAMVELPEGPRMMGTVTDCDIADVHVGMAVEAYAAKVAEETALVYWRPAARSASLPQ